MWYTVKNWQSYPIRRRVTFVLELELRTRAEVDGTPSQIPAFWPGVKVRQNVAQYLLHNMTYAPVKFEVNMSNG